MADESEAPDAGADAAPKKGTLIPLLVAVLVGLVAGAAAGIFGAGPMLAARVVPPVDTASLAAQLAAGGVPGAHDEEPSDDHAKDGEGKEGAEAAPPAVHLLDNIVMNPAGSNGQRFLLLSVAYELESPEVGEKLKVRDAEVRDVVQRVVGSRPIEQLGDMSARDALKADVLRATEEVVGPKSIARVFFPQFVIQ